MEMQFLLWVVKICTFACFLVLQGSSVLHPPLSSPPHSVFPNAPTIPPPYDTHPPAVTSSGIVPVLPPRNQLKTPEHHVPPAMVPEAPVPVSSPLAQSPPKPPSINSPVPGSLPPNPHENTAPVNVPFAPVHPPASRTSPHIPPPIQLVKPVLPPSILPVAPFPRTLPHTPPPIQLVRPVSPPSILPEPAAPSPRTSPPIQLVKPVSPPSVVSEPFAPSPSESQGSIPPVQPILPYEPPFSSPGHRNATPPPAVNPKRIKKPFAAPLNETRKHRQSRNPSPATAPSAHGAKVDLDVAPPPLPYPKSSTGKYSPAPPPSTSTQNHHRHQQRDNMNAPGPLIYTVPHAPINQAPHHPKAGPKINLGHHVFPPSESAEGHSSSAPSPSLTSPSRQIRMPTASPRGPSWSLPRNRKMPFHALPPPPPNEDCTSLTCSEPLTNSLPGPLCICVLPIQVGLRLSVELYTFFPLVPELASEISVGVFMKQGQVRIMGANAASQDPEKTIVLIDLVPLGENFDNTTAYLTFQRFWYKQVNIKTNIFSDYEVLYVRYPGLPPSPPSASSDIDNISGDPYQGHDNNTRPIPLGVDVRKNGDKNRHSRSIIAIVLLSASISVILCCALAWILFFKQRGCLSQSERIPPTTIPSLGKSSGVPASTFGSGPSSASLSLGSSIATYAGSAKTFSSIEIERATDSFSETRVLGEGGFGRVYSGVLDDGTKVAVKILKRDDHQGGREFLAEVEMLSRLHHRNLVKLIGICTEERTRCLVYELIANGSVESHLHGVDKEIVPLDWAARLKIALGAARGLAYLHEDSSPRVIHRDFKSSNILLEDDFTPKVSDFGLARTALDEGNRHISTRVMGTFGYVAPEYAMTGHLLVKSDVYSYGVVLLELLTGRKPVDMSRPPGEENLVSWARPFLASEEGLALVVDPYLGPDFPFDSITKVAAIASMCVQPEVSQRPFMGEVVQALKLVCNEGEETEVMGSRNCSRDLLVDVDARIGTKSEHMLDPLSRNSPISHYDPRLDIERGLSISEILSSSANNRRPEYDSLRRHSSSGPLQTKNSRRLWQKIRRIYKGSTSEHGQCSGFSLYPSDSLS